MLESDQDRWLTYTEAGELLGISAQAARMLAKRRGWGRRTPNAYGDRAQVRVPADVIVQPRSASVGVHTGSVITSDQGSPNGHNHPHVRALEQAIAVLRDQFGTANQRADEDRARADRAEQEAARLRVELIELRVSERIAERAAAEALELRKRLDEAATAERIARDETAGLRAELDARREWGLPRRLRWALGRKR